jgi:hypothetical protein
MLMAQDGSVIQSKASLNQPRKTTYHTGAKQSSVLPHIGTSRAYAKNAQPLFAEPSTSFSPSNPVSRFPNLNLKVQKKNQAAMAER